MYGSTYRRSAIHVGVYQWCTVSYNHSNRVLAGNLSRKSYAPECTLALSWSNRDFSCVFCFWTKGNQNSLFWKLPENLLGKLVFELEHAVTFEDEVRFGPLKILEYLHDKFFKMVVLDTMLERLLCKTVDYWIRMAPRDQDQEDHEDMVAKPVTKEILNAVFARSLPLTKLVISNKPMTVHVCDYRKQR
jgi:hypothetical protein